MFELILKSYIENKPPGGKNQQMFNVLTYTYEPKDYLYVSVCICCGNPFKDHLG